MTGILFYKLFNKNTFLKCRTDFIRGYYARIDKICVYHEGIQGAKSTKKVLSQPKLAWNRLRGKNKKKQDDISYNEFRFGCKKILMFF